MGGTDTVISTVSYSIDSTQNGRQFIENLTLAGASAINATGNDLANRLTGNDAANTLLGGLGTDTLLGNGGNDTLDGGSGIDQMFGGSGDDNYFVDNAFDKVYETANTLDTSDSGGRDKVTSSVSYSLADTNNGRQFIENLTLTGTADSTGTGNGLANVITGNSGSNLLIGGG
jgi:Ca2+-binding RTX toxin-like protein